MCNDAETSTRIRLSLRTVVAAFVLAQSCVSLALAQEGKKDAPAKSTPLTTLSALVKRGYEIKSVVSGLDLVARTCKTPAAGELFQCFEVSDDVKTTVTRTRFLLQKATSFFICDTAYDLTKNEQPAIGTKWDTLSGPTWCREAKFD